MTIRPLCAKRFAAAPLLSVISPLRPFVRPTDVDGLDRAHRGRPLDLFAQRVVGVVVILHRLVAVNPKYHRCNEDALRVALKP
jgi:hypothetical protein